MPPVVGQHDLAGRAGVTTQRPAGPCGCSGALIDRNEIERERLSQIEAANRARLNSAAARLDQARALYELRQDQLEIGRGMLEVQNVDWTTLLRYYADDIEYHDSIVDVYGIDMLTQFLARLYGSSPDLVTTIEDETLVDGVYSADPMKVADAVKYERLSYDEVLDKKLEVMDLTAICLCRDHGMPVRVFEMDKSGALLSIVRGGSEGTLIE